MRLLRKRLRFSCRAIIWRSSGDFFERFVHAAALCELLHTSGLGAPAHTPDIAGPILYDAPAVSCRLLRARASDYYSVSPRTVLLLTSAFMNPAAQMRRSATGMVASPQIQLTSRSPPRALAGRSRRAQLAPHACSFSEKAYLETATPGQRHVGSSPLTAGRPSADDGAKTRWREDDDHRRRCDVPSSS